MFGPKQSALKRYGKPTKLKSDDDKLVLDDGKAKTVFYAKKEAYSSIPHTKASFKTVFDIDNSATNDTATSKKLAILEKTLGF